MAFSTKIATSLTQYLEAKGWQYSFDEIHGVITVEAMLSCKLDTALLVFSLQEDALLCYTALSVTVPTNAVAAVGEYLHRANYGLPNGNFELDYDEGTVHFKVWCSCLDEVLTAGQIEECFSISLTIVDRYGDGLLDVMENSVSYAKRTIDALDADVR